MSRELVYRMKTCAAAIRTRQSDKLPVLYQDAADLLDEASGLLEFEQEQPPMQPIDLFTSPPAPPPAPLVGASWTGMDFPVATPRTCPTCGSEAPKIVHRGERSRRLILECPACGSRWEFKP
jgi:hypothetical protein